jgi:roadblock/LC7 domain-containing protein
MQMHETGEVIQVAGATSANAKINEGWKLLAVISAGNGSDDGKTVVWYVLGKKKPTAIEAAVTAERELIAKNDPRRVEALKTAAKELGDVK